MNDYLESMSDRTPEGLAAAPFGRSQGESAKGDLESLGELVGTVIHEVNQPLAAISAGVQAALHWLVAGDHGNAHEAMEGVAQDVTRANAVVAGLRSLLRGYGAQFEPVRLNDLVHDVLTSTRPRIELDGVDVALDLCPTLPPVPGDRVQLQQVIQNIVLNGAEAIQDLGVDGLIHVRTRLVDSSNVELSISDNGAGVTPERMPRLFDVFYTTKSGGLGLGLPICRRIVGVHRGRIWAEGNEGGGLTVKFTVPAA